MTQKYVLVSFLAPLPENETHAPGSWIGDVPRETLFVSDTFDAEDKMLQSSIEIHKLAFQRALNKTGWPKLNGS